MRLRTSNRLDLMIYAYDYYWFWRNIQAFILNIWKGKKVWNNKDIYQDMEGLVIKRVEIHVEIKGMEIFQDMENFLDMEAQHHTLYLTNISRRKNYVIRHITYARMSFVNICLWDTRVDPNPMNEIWFDKFTIRFKFIRLKCYSNLTIWFDQNNTKESLR